MPANMGRDGQGSAKIYQFPAGGRASVNDQRRLNTDLNARLYNEPVVTVSSAGSWYHEEAIRESQRGYRETQQKKPVVVPLTFPHH